MTAFAAIPSGWFQMGSGEGQEDERPVHRVWVDTFEIGIFPVTRQEYGDFLSAAAHEPPRDWMLPAFAAADLPVVGVSWHDARLYCEWRSGPDTVYRLPAEAEWERAARGNRENERYPYGAVIPDWIPNAGRGPLAAPWPVTLGTSSDFGLYGIAANIHEWCADWHDPGFYSASPDRNPTGPMDGRRRVSRGGSWRHAFTISRTAARSKLDPTFRYTDYGFRVVRSAPIQAQQRSAGPG